MIQELLDDLLYLVGAAVVGAGVWMIYPPAAVVFAGLVIIGLGVVVSQGQTASEDDSQTEGA